MLYVFEYTFRNGSILIRAWVGCGDVEDIAANGGKLAPDADCSAACSGDPIHLCGGSERLSLYFWSQDEPLNVWHTPEVTGQYEVSVSTSNESY